MQHFQPISVSITENVRLFLAIPPILTKKRYSERQFGLVTKIRQSMRKLA
jgi:hypothetical protein